MVLLGVSFGCCFVLVGYVDGWWGWTVTCLGGVDIGFG